MPGDVDESLILEALRHDHRHFADLRVTADSPGDLEGVCGNCLEMVLEIDPSDAQVLGISRKVLWEKLKDYGIE
mgnify:CR=1 FL=1